MQTPISLNYFLFLFLILNLTPAAWSDCDITPAQEETFTVTSCLVIDPYENKILAAYYEGYPKRFVESARDQMAREAQMAVEAYRGALINAETPDRKPVKYLVQGDDPRICMRFPARAVVKAEVTGACCDGDINPPCYLGFRNLVTLLISVQVDGKDYVAPPPSNEGVVNFENVP